MWAHETRIKNLTRAEEGKSESIATVAPISQIAPCEWLVGLGPCGSLTLWSVHCLDDIYPPRCPRVMMWQQRSGLLPSICTSIADKVNSPLCLLNFKVVANRPENGLSGPPSSIDLFENFMGGHHRWSRIWPPVSAIGGDGGSNGAALLSSSAKKNAWGISSELLHVYGHLGSVISMATHPVTSTRLAASLDDKGVVLIWFLTPCLGPSFDIGSFQVPVWRLSDRSEDRLFCFGMLDMLAWAPPILPGSRAVLVVGSSCSIDCYLISKTGNSIKEKFGAFSIVHDHLLRLTLPLFGTNDNLKGVYTVSRAPPEMSDQGKASFSVVGIGQQSSLLSWNLEIQVDSRDKALHSDPVGISTCDQMQDSGIGLIDELDIYQIDSLRNKESICTASFQQSKGCTRYLDDFANERGLINFKCNLLDSTGLNDMFEMTCVDVATTPMEYFETSQIVPEALVQRTSAYDLVTGDVDGFLRFWKVHLDTLSIPSVKGKSFWECVGVVQIATQPLKLIAVALGGGIIAFAESLSGGLQRIKILEVMYCSMKLELVLSGEILVTDPVTTMSWFDLRNAQLLLGVASQNHVCVYAETKVSFKEFCDSSKNFRENSAKSSWVCLASVSLSFSVGKLLWAPNGSILVASESHVCALSQWTSLALSKENDTFGDKEAFTNFKRCAGNFQGSCISQTPSKDNPHCKSLIKQWLHCLFQKKSSCTLLEAAGAISCPLPEYHPKSILHFLQTGKQKQARSCLRHLGKHLISASQAFSETEDFRCEYTSSSFPKFNIPHMHLEDLFDLKNENTKMDSNLQVQELFSNVNTSSHLFGQEASSSVLSKKYDFLDTKAWLDDQINGAYQEELQSNVSKGYDGILKSGGAEHLTVAEADLLVNAIDHCAEVPGILVEEKSQILATIDVLAEIDSGEQAHQFASLDQAGQRFWLATRYVARLNARKVDGINFGSDIIVDSKAMAWAFQSENKEALLDMCLSKKLSWPSLRAFGVGFWLTDIRLLRITMEKLARAQYLERKDPKDCAPLYLALGRQSVLSGLFKLGKDERDKPLVEFLSRNFQDEKNKAAALKNAYTLMGKHRHELAVGLFLLGGDLSSASSVCVKNLGDPQLGLVICHLVEGSAGPTGFNLISKSLIPAAREDGDNWLASLLRSLLQDPTGSLCELTSSKELTAVDRPSDSERDLKDLITETSTTSRCFLLDSDIGYYCKVLATKPAMRAVLTDAGISETISKASFTASFALKRTGLPLQALEQLDSCLKKKMKIKASPPVDEPNLFEGQKGTICHLNSSSTDKGVHSWISPAVGAGIEKSLRETLALQYLAQLLLDHHGHANSLSKDVGNKEVAAGSLAKADLQLCKDLDFLTRSFSLDMQHIAIALATVAQHYGSYHLSCRLACGKAQSEDKFHLANELEVADYANKLLYLFNREAPWMVCRIVLARTKSVYSGLNENDTSQTNVLVGDGRKFDQTGFERDLNLLEAQLLQLIRFSKELLLLADALSATGCNDIFGDERKVSKGESKRNTRSVLYLFPFVCLIAAAWLGRKPRALLALVKPACNVAQTIANPRLALFNFNLEGNNLDSFCAKWSRTSMEATVAVKLEATSISTLQGRNSTQTTKEELSSDALWLGMGYSLWSHLLSSVKQNLHGTASEVSYVGYGRTSPLQSAARIAKSHPITPSSLSPLSSPPSTKESHVSGRSPLPPDFIMERDSTNKASSTALKDLEGILLNSLACISTGLRKQMASSFRGILQSDVSFSLLDMFSGNQEHKDDSWRELYKLLVDWEEIESCLRLEGIDLRRSDILRHADAGWSVSSNESIQVCGSSKTGNGGTSSSSSSANTKTTTSEAQHGFNTKHTAAQGLNGNLEPEKQTTTIRFQKAEEIFHISGELFEALCVNTCSPSQVVIASNRKGLIYYDLKTHSTFTGSIDNFWSEADWPRNGWAGSVSTPVPTFVSPGVGLGSKEGSGIGLGGATVGIGALERAGKDIGKGAVGFGIPGYAGMAAWGLGWEEWEDFDGFVDPPATIENVGTKAMDAHPLRPLFLVGSNNTHVYLWEFGKSLATATYGVLPAANVPPPYALASISAVRFDRSGDRFATAALDGTVCTWQLEVGGRSNVCPTESSLCFTRHATDVKFVGASGGIIAATGSSQSGENLVIWDTLAPPASSRVSVVCHEGGARCLDLFDHVGSSSPLIVTGGKAGDVSVHDFRYIATGKSKRQKSSKLDSSTSDKPSTYKEHSAGGGLVWFIPKAHSASITTVSAVPGTSLFLTGSKDGDVKLWDVKSCELVSHWSKVHERHMFLQHNSRGFGAVLQAAVTAIQVVPSGFITCGGDGAVRLFQHLNYGVTGDGG
ncbi:hypothetical protein O6H91_05G036700 [Diphasiastrum complanatum]|nr:hypothetical protein O6H91_05G036700 [Diphasiastrum complanatum]